MSNDAFTLKVPDRIASKQMVWITIDVRRNELLLFTADEWEKAERKVKRIAPFPGPNRRFRMHFDGYATRVSVVDGYVFVPPFILDAANLDGQSEFVDRGRYCSVRREGRELTR